MRFCFVVMSHSYSPEHVATSSSSGAVAELAVDAEGGMARTRLTSVQEERGKAAPGVCSCTWHLDRCGWHFWADVDGTWGLMWMALG